MSRTVEFSLRERLKIANAIFGGEAYVIPETYTLKAYSNTIALDGTGGTELDNDGYSAIEFDNDTTMFPHATSTLPKASAVEYHKDFEEDASIQSEGLFDEDGHLVLRVVYDPPLEVLAGQQWRFAVGAITLNPRNPS